MTTQSACLRMPAPAKRKTAAFHLIKTGFLFLLIFINTVSARAQCTASSMSFHSPVLLSGTENQIGSIYLFANVIPGVDANIQIVDLVGGAAVWNIDDTTGLGYYDAFQPYIVAPANTVSYVDWKMSFKVAGSSVDTILPCFAITAIDVDGNGVSLQEFVEAATPGSFAVDPYTILNFSFDGMRSKAVSTVDNIPSIDTSRHEAMYQMNFKNISSLQYRNGAISNYGGDMVRQTSIYFKSFFENYTMLLPVTLKSFSAQAKNESVLLSWSAATENDLQYYTVQKSNNGIAWKDAGRVLRGTGTTNNYYFTDAGKNAGVIYYRLQQTVRTGQVLSSKVLTVHAGSSGTGSITSNTVVKDAINMQINALVNDNYRIEVYAMNGNKIKQQQMVVLPGFNTALVEIPASTAGGLYVLTVKNRSGELIYQSKLIRP